jgi:hypothetical protein
MRPRYGYNELVVLKILVQLPKSAVLDLKYSKTILLMPKVWVYDFRLIYNFVNISQFDFITNDHL